MNRHDSFPLSNLSIAMVEDNPAFVKSMRAALARHFFGQTATWSFAAYPDAEAFREAFLRVRPDIVMLDILLPGENGIDLARWIYELDERPIIAFITASPDFAFHGYGVNALAYMLKPLTDASLASFLEACEKRLRLSGVARLAVRCPEGKRVLEVNGITHLESKNRRVFVHCRTETVKCIGKLDDFAACLPESFIRVHKSFIVNLNRVAAMRATDLTLDNGEKVPMSRRYGKHAVERFFTGLKNGETHS